MARPIRDYPEKKRGRPATGKAPLVGVRMTEDFQASIRAWAKKQPDEPALAPAIRRLIDIGLTVKQKRKQTLAAGAARAKELAARAIDNMADGRASLDDREHRKRRLLKGPEEFREARVDRAKARP